jgi:pimeloyl-[acyl-carrier protein] methyl ester esterase
MRLVLVHGWAFDAAFWDGVVSHLGAHEIERAEFGYFGAPPHLPDLDADAICVGHSLGALWLLTRGSPMAGMMAINGFARFSGRETALRAMRAGLRRDADAQVASFRAASQAPSAAPASAEPLRLAEGLDALARWDGSSALAALGCEFRALCARNDPISPQDAALAFGERVVWSDRGGHVLPLSRPDWCAAQIQEFADHVAAQ